MRSAARQGGSVKVFVIVAIVLALVAFGVFYGVRRVAMNNEITPPVAAPDQSEVDNGEENQTGDADEDSDTSSTSTDDGTDSEQPVAELPDTTDTTDSDVTTQTEDTTDTEALPQTGPAETLSAVALALVVTSGVAYIRSLKLV